MDYNYNNENSQHWNLDAECLESQKEYLDEI